MKHTVTVCVLIAAGMFFLGQPSVASPLINMMYHPLHDGDFTTECPHEVAKRSLHHFDNVEPDDVGAPADDAAKKTEKVVPPAAQGDVAKPAPNGADPVNPAVPEVAPPASGQADPAVAEPGHPVEVVDHNPKLIHAKE